MHREGANYHQPLTGGLAGYEAKRMTMQAREKVLHLASFAIRQ
jgi:hypothetical protein